MMTLQAVLSKLEKVKSIGNGEYQALCPAHNDTNPSLHVKQGDKKILLNCKAGCSIDTIVGKLGIALKDLSLDTPRRATATYSYQGESGREIYRIIRYVPKSFSVERPDGKGGYVSGLGDTPKVLYHLPDILKAITHQDTIYIVEGEKDADNLWNIGLIATTNPFGAGKWNGSYSESLRGAKEVIVIPDSDQPGHEHAEAIIRALIGKVKSVKVVILPTQDVSDYLEEHGFDDLEKLVKESPPLTPLNVNTLFNSLYTCNPTPELYSNRTKTAQKEHNFGIDDVREFVASQGSRYFEIRTMDYELGIVSAEAKHYRRRLIALLEERKELEKHPADGKKYRQIDRNALIDYKACSLGNSLELWLPFDIHHHFSVYPGNLLCFAGVTDSGKTALAINIIANNDDMWVIDYWTNEVSGEELNERLQNISPSKYIDDWRFKARSMKPGYLQQIRPDILSIFDYIDVGDPFYRIAEEQQSIHDAIGRGVAIIFLQKDDAKILGRGRAFSAQLPRLYISMNMKSAYAYKAKTPKNPDNPLKGKTCDFKLRNGVHFEFGEWRYKVEDGTLL